MSTIAPHSVHTHPPFHHHYSAYAYSLSRFVVLLISVLLTVIHIYICMCVSVCMRYVDDFFAISLYRSVEFSISTFASLLDAAVRELQCRWSCLLLVTVTS